MPTESPRHLLARARAAAKTFPRPSGELGWADALAAAPWPSAAAPAWESDFRRAFAEALVKRKIAKPAARSGAAVRRSGPSAPTKLMRRLLSATPSEFEEQDRRADGEGLSWSCYGAHQMT